MRMDLVQRDQKAWFHFSELVGKNVHQGAGEVWTRSRATAVT